jgi:peptide/nickel transport system substrate-binding protein
MTQQTTRRRLRALGAGIGLALAMTAMASPTTNAAKVSAPKQGGDITVGIFNQLQSTCFSPNAANSALGVMRTVYEGLLEQRADGKVVPYLAQSITSSADFKQWTIGLRSGIKYHDGTDMTVTSVITNLQAIRGLTTSAPFGRHTLGSGVPLVANIKDIRPASATSLTIELWNGQRDFDEWMYASGRFFMRATSDLANATQCTTKGKGTGPFMFESVSPTEVKVVRNPNYWRKDKNGVQLPYLNSITFKYVNQPTQRVNGLKSGTLDAAGFTSAGEIKQIINVRANKNVITIASPDDYYSMSMFNYAIAPFNNKNARLAVAYAWDLDTYYQQRHCFKGQCVGTKPTSAVGKRNIGYNESGFIKYDLKKAKEYVAAYKAETGQDLAFSLPTDTSAESQANSKAFAQIMKKAGITVTIATEDTATITAKAFPTPGTGFNPYQMYPTTLFEGTGANFTLPFLQSNAFRAPGINIAGVVGAANAPTFLALGAAINPARFNDPAQDSVVWTAMFDTTATRTKNLKAVTKYIQENAAVLPTPSTQYLFGFSKKLGGYDKFILASGGQGRAMTNAGPNWTGVYIQD